MVGTLAETIPETERVRRHLYFLIFAIKVQRRKLTILYLVVQVPFNIRLF